jgi:hypothetical protein
MFGFDNHDFREVSESDIRRSAQRLMPEVPIRRNGFSRAPGWIEALSGLT